MKSLGIKYQILLITLIPVFLIDLLFTYKYIDSSIEQANDLLQDKGRIIARQIAGASEFNLYTGNDDQIQYLLDQSVGSNDVVLASVYDRQGNLIAESLTPDFRQSDLTDYVYHRQFILSQSIEHSDVFSPDSGEGQRTSTLGWVHLYLSRQQLQRATRQIIIDSIVFFISVLIMAFILTIAISRRITSPIFDLMEHLKLVETGQLGKIIEPTEDNEIGAVQKGFNRMTQALLTNRRHLNQRIQQATQQLNEAITELETRNRELGFARDQAQNANRSKSEFLANMSHEIRTPINGITGFVSLLSQSKLDQSQQRYVDIVLKSTGDLTKIVNEILDFSKMESGKLHIVDEEFDLYEVVEQTRDILFINVLTKNIDLNLIIFSDTPRRLVGDKLRLKQILLNLIGNAIKFTDQGRVVIRVVLEDQRQDRVDIEISVEDSGIGISEDDQQNLFQAFSQVVSSDTRRFAGTGLGLVISKNLATLMGGDIEMHSEKGKGSRFVLRLPFRTVHENRQAAEANTRQHKALIFAAENICLMETRSLFDRAGAITECSLVDNRSDADPVIECIQRNQAYVDLLVFDLRHLTIDIEKVLNVAVAGGKRVILVDYDRGVEPAATVPGVEFVSVINTSRTIAELLSHNPAQIPHLPTGTGKPAAACKKVLLVDDNPVNLKLGSELIRLWGHEVTEVEHGADALDIYMQREFDLIILDIQMPDIDGVSLLQMMRDHNPGDQTPIVALTANVLNNEADRLLELGFDYFLEKPIDEEKFRSLLDGEPRRRSEELLPQADDETIADCSMDYTASLALSADNESLLVQILEIILRDIPGQQQQLRNAAQKMDRARLGAALHKLHGVTCYASLPRLRRQVLDLQQQLARDGEVPLEQAVAELIDELEAVKLEVERHLLAMGGSGPDDYDSSTTIATT
ncbi:MAG: ATP-binding protein [Gammaproteobacteria bacterium]|nr:ATP-binding protein [Gammaproteobacteria bacterium]